MSKTQRVWLIDAGHAPATKGKRSPVMSDGRRLLEWEFAREISGMVRELLDDAGIANHILTPHEYADMKPSVRAKLANAIPGKTALFSIHGNAAGMSGWHDASGIATLHYPKSRASIAMAKVFQWHLVEATMWRDRGLKPRSNLTILKATRMPSVLVECGFYSNLRECDRMMQNHVRHRIAGGIADAINAIEAK